MKTKHKHDIPDELIDQLMKQVKTSDDLTGPDGLMRTLMGRLVERALSAELTEHLGYEAGEARPEGQDNARNGSTPKTVKTVAGEVPINVPRDRDGTFEPQLVKKHERRLSDIDERILALYARGMSVREISEFLKEAYGADVSPTLISRVTDAVNRDVEAWRDRRLDPVYTIVYFDGLTVKVRTDGVVQPRTVYIVLAVNLQGHKEVLGLWMGGNEGARFWLHVVTELQNRGMQDMLVACCDGLKGFPEAIEAIFPRTVVQTCVVHMIRNSLRYVAWGRRREVAKALRPIYQADTEQQALAALDAFEAEWGELYPSIPRSWRSNWDRISPFFAFAKDIRRVIYTTNAIESLNRQLRKMLKTKGPLPSEEAAMKLLYLAINRATEKWRMPIQHWDLALQQFAIHFDGRVRL